jgi:hypothetical protein
MKLSVNWKCHLAAGSLTSNQYGDAPDGFHLAASPQCGRGGFADREDAFGRSRRSDRFDNQPDQTAGVRRVSYSALPLFIDAYGVAVVHHHPIRKKK